nr:integrase, catalytic region, zinc finger, CCHC-type, peptidase aspartic, catalytic [Tanacetum cinerariifolium]
DDDVDEQPVQDLALNVDKMFQADDCDVFDSDVDEARMTQTIFMANLSSADPVTDEAGPSYDSDILFEVAIGYKNPLCLTRAKKVQPALYNGHEIFKDDYVPAIVHNKEDTLEIPEITRKKTNDKIKDPKCVTRKTTVSRPIKALTVGFKQTKECYLKEVIPFFKTPKDNFKGIQKALTKEIKKMKDVFEELEAEVAQNVVDRKHDAIERKNLPIANDNLIAECLSKEVFSVATNSKLNVARFTKMHVANTLVEARCLALKHELANLRDKSHHDN